MYKYWFTDIVCDKNTDIWYFFGKNVPGFFSWNRVTNRIELIDNMENHAYENDMYDQGVIVNGKIYYPPCKVSQYAIYDIAERTLNFRELYSEEIEEKMKYEASTLGHFVVKKNEVIYFVHREYPIITRINTIDNKKKYIRYEQFPNYFLELGHNHNGDVYYFPTPVSNRIYTFDAKDETMGCIELIEFPNVKISSCLYDEGRLLITSIGENYIYTYSLNTRTTTRKKMQFEQSSNVCRRFVKKFNGFYYILPMIDFGEISMVYQLNYDLHIINSFDLLKAYRNYIKLNFWSDEEDEWYVLIKRNDSMLDLLRFPKKLILAKMNMAMLLLNEVDIPLPEGINRCQLSDQIVHAQSKLLIKQNSIIVETKDVNLDFYLRGM